MFQRYGQSITEQNTDQQITDRPQKSKEIDITQGSWEGEGGRQGGAPAPPPRPPFLGAKSFFPLKIFTCE